MKALSIKEPWASYILSGQKTIETRTWKTNYRGKVLLCASQKPKGHCSGYAFAIATITDCIPMTREHESKAMINVYPKAWSWILSDVTPIKPFEIKGKLGLFEVDYEGKQ